MKTYVYFIRDHNDGLIKIGFSANVHRRMRSFRIVSGTDRLRSRRLAHEEQRIHGLFKAYRVYSEWFNDHLGYQGFHRRQHHRRDGRLYTLFAPYVRRNQRRREFPEKAPERQRSVPVLSPEAQARLDAKYCHSPSPCGKPCTEPANAATVTSAGTANGCDANGPSRDSPRIAAA